MTNKRKHRIDCYSLLEGIPEDQLRPEQVAYWGVGRKGPTYKFIREPNSLNELFTCSKAAIWQDNRTFIYIGTGMDIPDHAYIEKHLTLFFETYPIMQMNITIIGKQDDAIAETAAFLWRLKHTNDEKGFITLLKIRNSDSGFNFSAVRPEQLALCFEPFCMRKVEFRDVTLNVEQSKVLANRPFPIYLTFSFGVQLEDYGIAFVDVILGRQSNFGTFELDFSRSLSDDCFKRLLQQVKTIEKLKLGDEMHQLPLTASVQDLACTIVFNSQSSIDFSSFSAKSLCLIARSRDRGNPTDFLLSLFRRMTELGHCQALTLYLFGVPDGFTIPDHVAKELIRTITANRNLVLLRLNKGYLNWSPFSTEIASAMELNGFFRRTIVLVKQPPSVRSALVGTSLVERAAYNFPRTFVLLANHVDTLCELIQGVEAD